MSWSCDVCGKDRYDDHAACAQVAASDRIAERLERIIDLVERLIERLDERT